MRWEEQARPLPDPQKCTSQSVRRKGGSISSSRFRQSSISLAARYAEPSLACEISISCTSGDRASGVEMGMWRYCRSRVKEERGCSFVGIGDADQACADNGSRLSSTSASLEEMDTSGVAAAHRDQTTKVHDQSTTKTPKEQPIPLHPASRPLSP